ncbi:uncharacterized protein [Polyergus mexicanus]|uniref:uncharacterized protein n=1 Tax=Polyergus mexicanus TaxID=615972 RepID=UPI0038B64709
MEKRLRNQHRKSIELAIDSIHKRWTYISNNCSVPYNDFIVAIRFVLNSTFFIFNNIIYQQTFGTPMGSPLSPIIADVVLQDLEEKALATLCFTPSFYLRYVDDIALAAPSSAFEHILSVFNSFHSRLQFTMETSENDKLDFLDVTIILKNNRLNFDWFHKPTFSGRYLNFLSQHPLCQKRGRMTLVREKICLQFHMSHQSLSDSRV